MWSKDGVRQLGQEAQVLYVRGPVDTQVAVDGRNPPKDAKKVCLRVIHGVSFVDLDGPRDCFGVPIQRGPVRNVFVILKGNPRDMCWEVFVRHPGYFFRKPQLKSKIVAAGRRACKAIVPTI